MKKFLSIFFVVPVLIMVGFAVPKKAFAQTNFSSGNTVLLPKEQNVTNDYFAAGSTVILDGTVNGDAYIAGGNIAINGTVNGDVLAAGGNISINGHVTGNVRAVGGQIAVAGNIGRNVSVAGSTISLQYPAKVTGSVVAAASNLSLLAPTEKDITIAARQVSIDTLINGNVTGAVGQMDILPGTKIMGKLTYWSNSPAQIAQFTVKNGITYHHTRWDTQKASQPTFNTAATGFFAGFGIIWSLVSLLTSFVLGLILLRFFPVSMQQISTTLTTKPWASMGIGFLTVILLPIAFVTLLFTIIGIPLAIILLIVFILFALLNGIFISYAIGKKLLPRKNSLALVVGIVINGIISCIPVIGWIWNILTFFIGMGAIVLVEKEIYTALRERKII